jgi:cadmium resistance protein CadD (predicted permease)
LQTLLTAAVSFAATNMDDLLILTIFFSETDHSFRWWHIVAGQYIGFIALLVISLLGFLGSLVISREWMGVLGLAPMAIGISKFFTRRKEEPRVAEKTGNSGPFYPPAFIRGNILAPRTYLVASVTFANGGDNIGIYTPLFSCGDLSFLAAVISVFLLLLAAWCFFGYQLARRVKAKGRIPEYGHRVVPWVLIGLGMYIIWTNGSLRLIGR